MLVASVGGVSVPVGEVPVVSGEHDGPRWYTLQEVADRVGRTRQAIHARVKRGTLRAERKGGVWLVPAEVMEALIAAERAQGVSAGTIRVLHTGVGGSPTDGDSAEGLVHLVAELRADLEREREASARKDAYIGELRRHVVRLREALGALSEEPSPD